MQKKLTKKCVQKGKKYMNFFTPRFYWIYEPISPRLRKITWNFPYIYLHTSKKLRYRTNLSKNLSKKAKIGWIFSTLYNFIEYLKNAFFLGIVHIYVHTSNLRGYLLKMIASGQSSYVRLSTSFLTAKFKPCTRAIVNWWNYKTFSRTSENYWPNRKSRSSQNSLEFSLYTCTDYVLFINRICR